MYPRQRDQHERGHGKQQTSLLEMSSCSRVWAEAGMGEG